MSACTGVPLTLDEYVDGFERHHGVEGVGELWKIERTQVFQEEGNASCAAFLAGDRARSLALIAERLPQLEQQHRAATAHGMVVGRVRVVEEPLDPYVLWELTSQVQRAALGEQIKVVDAADLAGLEAGGPLPDLVGFDDAVVYFIHYTPDGVPTGATAATDHQVAHWRQVYRSLHDAAEPVADYHARRVAPELPEAP
ncbi:MULTISPECIES: DUF6879 family protein [Actinosynnema]|uniref:DUF6879 domain-containing protein n=1 Tax=Actinosynnema pretiosum TaxID=42197 RepID=A0A290ZDR7_9PSEU|nr:DUF6879 family protein [Actinosynnema pretiosum]ATE57146.1 hypothetical protein CNX65_30825 [Actinosynnema pretiosum]